MAALASRNRLVRAVSTSNRKAFLADCSMVDHAFSDQLSAGMGTLDFVHFPLTAYISQLASLEGSTCMEIGLIGDEGMLGATLLLDVDQAPQTAIVQGAGTMLRMERARFLEHLKVNVRLERLLKHYLFVQVMQLQQAAVCTRFHVVEERLARWLLMVQDRAHSQRFHMTQQYLAEMLGVRRVGVTQAASALQQRGLIRYHRGEIVVLDRAGLEQASCACYQADCAVYHQLMA